MKKVLEKYHALSDEEKKPYEKQAEEDKERYNKEVAVRFCLFSIFFSSFFPRFSIY